MTHKQCRKCKETKPLSEFYYVKYRDSLHSQCKSCKSEYRKEYRNKNKEWATEQNRKYYAKNKEKESKRVREWQEKNRDRYNQTVKRWAAKHKKEKSHYDTHYYQKNKERIIKRINAYQESNPVDPKRQAENSQRRRARVRNNGVYKISNKFLQKIYSSPCAGCGTLKDISADHIIPIARGGRHSEGNLQSLCRSCNSSKGSKTMMEWKMFNKILEVS